MATVMPFSNEYCFDELHLNKAYDLRKKYEIPKTAEETARIKRFRFWEDFFLSGFCVLTIAGTIALLISALIVGLNGRYVPYLFLLAGFGIILGLISDFVETYRTKAERPRFNERFRDNHPESYLMIEWWKYANAHEDRWGWRGPKGWANGYLPSKKTAREVLKSGSIW